MLDRGCSRQDRIQRRDKVVSNRAAETAVGEFDDVLLRTRLLAARLENFPVNADSAELVHDHGQPPPICVGQDVPDQCRFAGSEKAGHDRAGHACGRFGHSGSSKLMGGTRAMSPRLSDCGRPRHGMMPSAALASRRAPSTSADAQAASRPPKTYVQEPLQRTAALKPRVQFAKHRTGLITTPLPSAASAVAAARIAPGRGSVSGPPGCRQVMHTYTIAAPANACASVSLDFSIELTRAAPQGRNPGA